MLYRGKVRREKALKKVICKVCGRRIALVSQMRYTAVESKGITGAFTGTKRFDAFDCPGCGCQNIVGERYEMAEPEGVSWVLEGQDAK